MLSSWGDAGVKACSCTNCGVGRGRRISGPSTGLQRAFAGIANVLRGAVCRGLADEVGGLAVFVESGVAELLASEGQAANQECHVLAEVPHSLHAFEVECRLA